MSEFENAIFFDTVAQFTTDPSAGATLLEAVAAYVEDESFSRSEATEARAESNLRWFSAQPREVKIQIVALSGTVRKYYATHGERASMTKEPAARRLEHFEIAVSMYRNLKQKKKAVVALVQKSPVQSRAAYKAIVRVNYTIIKEMRQSHKAWSVIGQTLKVLTGQKVPPALLPVMYKEVEAEIKARANLPKVMTHYEGERTSEETIAAYRAAGYDGIEPPQFERSD